MIKITKTLLVLAFTALSLQTASAASRNSDAGITSAGIGFDLIGSYYMPADSRYQGIGMGYGMNIKMDDSLTMGYRVEELQVRAEDKVGAANVADNHVVTFQGITAYYRTVSTDRLSVDFGLWMGSANSGDLNSVGAGSVSSPFIEPLGRFVYSSEGRIESRVTVGVGYKFVRRATMSNPFGAGAGVADLKNFDGLEINFGVGLAF
jgi:hypothetical protein